MLWIIIAANVALFGAMALSTGQFDWSARVLLAWGGNYGDFTLHGQWWRLLTYQYLHAGPGHILGNLVLLAIAGNFVLAKVGPARFLLAYTVSGVAAGAVSALGHPNIVGVGASGAIAGIVGMIVAFYASGRCPEIRGSWVAQTVGINVLYSLAPSVDWLAHLGGFATGLAFGGALLAMSVIPPRTIEG